MRVFIGMPVYRATSTGNDYVDLPGPVAASLYAARQALGPETIFKRANHGTIDRARSELVGVFLESPATHLFFWDNDMTIPTAAVAALIAAALDPAVGMVAVPQRYKDRPGFSVLDYDPATQTSKFCGMGAMLVSRRVFEAAATRNLDLRVPLARSAGEDDLRDVRAVHSRSALPRRGLRIPAPRRRTHQVAYRSGSGPLRLQRPLFGGSQMTLTGPSAATVQAAITSPTLTIYKIGFDLLLGKFYISFGDGNGNKATISGNTPANITTALETQAQKAIEVAQGWTAGSSTVTTP